MMRAIATVAAAAVMLTGLWACSEPAAEEELTGAEEPGRAAERHLPAAEQGRGEQEGRAADIRGEGREQEQDLLRADGVLQPAAVRHVNLRLVSQISGEGVRGYPLPAKHVRAAVRGDEHALGSTKRPERRLLHVLLQVG